MSVSAIDNSATDLGKSLWIANSPKAVAEGSSLLNDP